MRITCLSLIFILLSLSLFSQTTKNEPLKIMHLKGGFYVFTTYHNYNGVKVPSNGLYLVTEAGVVMIDTPWDSTQFKPLVSYIKAKHKKDVAICISTHSHEDRTAGLEFLAQTGTKTYTSTLTMQFCLKNGEKKPSYTFEKDTIFHIGNHTIQTYYAGAGHTKDNIVVWFPEAKLLYGGCLIKSTEAKDMGNVREADLKEWPKSLIRLKEKFPNPKFVIPGHQSWKNINSIDHSLKLLKAYEGKGNNKK